MIKPRKEIESIIPYQPGKPISDVQREFGLTTIYKLASNENPFGSSEKVKEALKAYIDGGVNLYPDGNATELRSALAAFTGRDFNEILASSGADEMIELIARAYLNPGDEVVTSQWTFSRYTDASTIMGAQLQLVPTKEYAIDLEGILDKVNEKTRLIWVCNPNNPTGSMITEKDLLDFFDRVPKTTLIVYDEAYREYVTDPDYPQNSQNFIDAYPNVIVMRTLSKIYGLAGIRCGFCLAQPEIIENINRVRPPFNVNVLAQTAGVVALEDQDFVQKVKANNTEQKNWIYDQLQALGLKTYPSQANFILFETHRPSSEIFDELQKRGVIVRPMPGNLVRVSIGLPHENQAFIEQLKIVLQ